MPAIVATTEINRSAAEVFAYATDPTLFSEWQTGVVSGCMVSSGVPAVGTHCRTTRRIGGADRPATSELTHIDPPRSWSIRGIDGPIRAIVDVAVEQTTDFRSRLTITVDFEGHGIGKVLVPLVVRREARREMPANLATLKNRLEAVSPPSQLYRPAT